MKLSIITTTFNSIKTLEKTLKSLFIQNYKNVEYIWIDNNSSDGTNKILKKNQSLKTKIINVKKKSIAKAWNIGINKSSGDIIYFLNSDDQLFDSNTFFDVIRVFKKHKCNIVFGNIIYINKNGKKVRNWRTKMENNKLLNNENILKHLKNGWMPPHTGFFIKKKYLIDIGYFNEKYKVSFDYDLIIRSLIDREAKVIFLKKFICKMLTGGNSNKLSNIILKMIEDFKIIKKNKIGGFITLVLKNFIKIPQFF